jgi:hypothetical protein
LFLLNTSGKKRRTKSTLRIQSNKRINKKGSQLTPFFYSGNELNTCSGVIDF